MQQDVSLFMTTLVTVAVAYIIVRAWRNYRRRRCLKNIIAPENTLVEPLVFSPKYEQDQLSADSFCRPVPLNIHLLVTPVICFSESPAQGMDDMAGQETPIHLRRAATLSLLFGILLITSCHKERTSISALLQSHTWLTSDVQVFGAGYQGESAIGICNLDNTIHFNSNGTVLFDYGAVTCDSTETRLYLVPWSLSEDEQYLEIGGLKYQLAGVTQDYLRFYLRDYSMNGINGKVDVYFMYVRQ
ncbi:MAG: hypothetical protein DI535_22770 [Citrobacter freundii]|nr:MAG: hypothetical protein DI535_22770 [Citrobacter freundii]